MTNNFTLVWSFRNRFDILKRSIETADKFLPKDINFCLVDAASSDETIKELRSYCNTITDRKIRITESAYRSSLSEAWNLGMMLSETRYVIFASSDVEFVNGVWFYMLKEAMMTHGLEYLLLENHAVFGFDKKAITKMGWFDEGYQIGAHFDSDFMLRSSEHGIKFGIIPNPGEKFYKHGHDEKEVELERNNKEFENRLPTNNKFNEEYFKNKWKSDWEGWQNWTHPPTHISQVKRNFPEVDPHPMWTKKFI